MKIFNLFKKKIIKKPPFFTFPDGKVLYQIDESDLHNANAKQYLFIQENINYLAYLGVTKHTINASIKKAQDELNEIKVLHKNKHNFSFDKLQTILDYLGKTRSEFDDYNEELLVNIFDLFFYFKGEDKYKRDAQTIELKRYYLNTYPKFRDFFFQNVKAKYPQLMTTYEPFIRYAISQVNLMQIIKELKLQVIDELQTK